MKTETLRVLLLLLIPFIYSCSPYVYPDRNHFLKDGDPIPTINLDHYKSVQLRPNQDSSMALALAISGGGTRAAHFGLGIMLGLENIKLKSGRTALDEIDYLSTNSGGGFAGGAYINSRFEHDYFKRTEAYSLREYIDRQIKDDLKVSYTGILLKANFNPRLWFSKVDDGDALEKAIDNHVLGYKRRKKEEAGRSIVLGDLFIPKGHTEKEVRYPMHFTNAAILSNWALFPFSPDVLEHYQIKGYTHRMQKVVQDSFDVYQMPLAVGIKASGSFPVLISNTTLISSFDSIRSFLHLVDGAMVDNIGYTTALEALKQDPTKRRVLFVIDAEADGSTYTFLKREKALSGIKVFGKLATSGIYYQHLNMEKTIKDIGEGYDIEPLIFAFDVLIEGNKEKVPLVFHAKRTRKELMEKLRTDMENIHAVDLHKLYELCNLIGTKYTIKPEEQEFLFLIGQKIVQMQEEKIRALLESE